MPTTPFAEEHQALRDSVRRQVADHLAPLAGPAEAGEQIHDKALAVGAQFAGLDDVLGDVVVAEELGRVRSGGLVAVLLDGLTAIEAGIEGAGPVAVARQASITLDAGTATGALPFLLGGQIAHHCLVPQAGVVLSAASGWSVRPIQRAHGLRGAAPADVTLDAAPATPMSLPPELLRRRELREAAAAVSGAWVTFEDARAYAGQRTAFGRPIGSFQVNRHSLVELATWLTAAEALVHDTAWTLAREGSAETAVARLVAGRTARRVADVALQLHGGYGYTSEFDVQRAWRDARALAIGDDERRRLVLDHQEVPT